MMESETKTAAPGTPVDFEEGTEAVRTSVCAECGGPLTLPWGGFWKHEGYLLQCGKDRQHRGVKPAETSMEYVARREGTGDRFMMMLQSNQDLQTLIADVKNRLIDHNKPVSDREVAAFLVDCAKVGLDPFSRQIFPVPFEDRSLRQGEGRDAKRVYRLTTIISVRGLASVAQRAMPETWVMAASAGEPVKPEDPVKALLLEGATRKRWVQQVDGKNVQVDETVDPGRVVMYRVKGRVRTREGIEETDWVYGAWHLDDEVYGTDKGNTPVNMARNRAIRGWYETYFPAAKAIMQGLQVPMLERAQGFVSALRIIEGKAVAVEEEKPALPARPGTPAPLGPPAAAVAPARQPPPHAASPQPSPSGAEATEFFEKAKEMGVQPAAALQAIGVKDWNEWKALGGTLDQALSQVRTKSQRVR